MQVDTFIEEDAEDLFDRYFCSGKPTIKREQFQRITESESGHLQKYLDLFDLADNDQDGIIAAEAFGAILNTRCRLRQNTVRDVYSLIDIEKNGWFNQADLDRFLNQILEPDTPESSTIRLSASK